MIAEHHAKADEEGKPRESEDEIRNKTHAGFWIELDSDFQWLCDFVKDGKRSAVMIMVCGCTSFASLTFISF